MKIIALIIFCFLFNWSIGQIKGSLPALQNISKVDIRFVDPAVPGKKIIFTQNCNPNLPDTVSNGIVQFENLRVVNDVVIASIEFKDTIVQRIIFNFETGDKDAMKYFGVPMSGFTELNKHHVYQSYVVGEYEYTCYIDRRKVILIKALPNPAL